MTTLIKFAAFIFIVGLIGQEFGGLLLQVWG